MLYRMVMLPMTVCYPNPPNHPYFCIFVDLYIFVLSERRDFKWSLGITVYVCANNRRSV